MRTDLQNSSRYKLADRNKPPISEHVYRPVSLSHCMMHQIVKKSLTLWEGWPLLLCPLL